MLRFEGASKRLDGTMKSAGLQTGRLGNQFAGLAGQIAHVHPIVGNLAGVLGNFAIGAGLTVGILAGVAAIAVVYDKLTESTRKAREEQDKLIASLEKAIHLKGLGPGGQTVDEVKAATDRAAALKVQIAAMDALIVRDALDADVLASNLVIQQKINKLVIERQNALNIAAGGQSIVDERVRAAVGAAKPGTVTGSDGASRAAAEALQASKTYWQNQTRLWERASEAVAKLNETARQYLLDNPISSIINKMGMEHIPDFLMPNLSMPFEGLTEKQKDNLRELGVIKDDANRNAQDTQAAIWGAAIQSANIIAGALNIGGGGRGSGIGGALGGAIGGAALGGKLGAFGGPVGAVVGAIAGSFIGGLFDHKKAVQDNTAATRQLTAAMVLNNPNVYKVARGRFDSTEIKQFRQGSIRYATRGGAPVMVVA